MFVCMYVLLERIELIYVESGRGKNYELHTLDLPNERLHNAILLIYRYIVRSVFEGENIISWLQKEEEKEDEIERELH